MPEKIEIHIVSDSTGDTAARVARAATHQYEDVEIDMIRHARVQTEEQLARALEDATGRPAVVFYTLVDSALREAIVDLARQQPDRDAGRAQPGPARDHDRVGHPGDHAARPYGAPGRPVFPPDRGHRVCGQARRRSRLGGLNHAEIVLVGVSRTSKTPTSMHLGYLGYMAANVPIVRGIDPPPALFSVDPWKVVGLTIDAERLAEIRARRVRALAAGANARYADLSEIYDELELASTLHRRLGCPVIDVSGLAIEEAAARVAELVGERRRAALEGART